MNNHTIRHYMNGKDWALLLLLSTMWGGSFIFMELTIPHFPTLTIVATRVTLAALALNSLWLIRREKFHYNFQVWKSFVIVGITGNVIPFSLFVWGQEHITAGLSSILNGTVPFFTVLGIYFFTRDEKMDLSRALGLLIGFVGVITIIGPSALAQQHTYIWRELAPLAAAICYAFALLYAKRFVRMGVPAIHVATGQLTCSAIILVPIALLLEKPWATATPEFTSVSALLALGLISTGLALSIYYRMLNTVGASNTSLVTFLMPISANIMAVTFLGEVLEITEILGMGLIFIGLFIMNRYWQVFVK